MLVYLFTLKKTFFKTSVCLMLLRDEFTNSRFENQSLLRLKVSISPISLVLSCQKQERGSLPGSECQSCD